MKVITRAIIDWATLEVEEEDSYEYEGPVALAKDSGSPPQPVDPWQQAAAQYALSTGTASYNADLNRPDVVNPLGSTTWTSTQPSGGATFGLGGGGAPVAYAPSAGPSTSTTTAPAEAHYGTSTGSSPNPLSYAGLTGGTSSPTGTVGSGAVVPGLNLGTGGFSLGAAPHYTESTQLAPQFQSILQQPIDTSGIAGMPGGPSTIQDLQTTRDTLYKQQRAYLDPTQQQQTSELDSRLANEGITPGSAAYSQAKDQLAREQTFADQQAMDSAISGGGQEQSRLFGLGSQALQNQINARNAPINEFEALQGAPGATSTALTPDISGAFGQQYQGQLAGYNANVASNNNTTSTLGSLALAAAMFFSDKRLKEDIKRVGKTDEGLPVYTYRFKGDPRTQMGVMAQDVEKVKPEAVFSLGGRGGPKMVDYGAIR